MSRKGFKRERRILNRFSFLYYMLSCISPGASRPWFFRVSSELQMQLRATNMRPSDSVLRPSKMVRAVESTALAAERDQLFFVLLAIAANARNVSAAARVTTTIMKP